MHNDAETARGALNLGALLARLGQRKYSEPLLNESLTLRKKILPPFHPDLGHAYSVLGRCQAIWNDARAVENLEQAYKIYCSAYGPASRQTGSVATALASYFHRQNDPVRMRHYASEAVEILADVSSSDSHYPGAMIDLGRAYLMLGRKAEACAAMRKSLVENEKKIDGRFFVLPADIFELQSVTRSMGNIPEADSLKARGEAMQHRFARLQRSLIPLWTEGTSPVP
jgi:tetratricopeptide (TPR) repeat protein